MANKERRQKNVKFGLSKDDNFDVENPILHEEGNEFYSTRDYWQHMCNGPRSPERKQDLGLQNTCLFLCFCLLLLVRI